MTIGSRTRHAASFALMLMLAACGGGDDQLTSGVGGSTPNRTPVFTSGTSASVAENSSGTIYTATATDADGNPLAFSLSGGADRADFQIGPASGALSFVASPDFEAPADANG
ncbi:MAG: cadherin repeat domain-containing protein, partial [Myxococcales bacterium]